METAPHKRWLMLSLLIWTDPYQEFCPLIAIVSYYHVFLCKYRATVLPRSPAIQVNPILLQDYLIVSVILFLFLPNKIRLFFSGCEGIRERINKNLPLIVQLNENFRVCFTHFSYIAPSFIGILSSGTSKWF